MPSSLHSHYHMSLVIPSSSCHRAFAIVITLASSYESLNAAVIMPSVSYGFRDTIVVTPLFAYRCDVFIASLHHRDTVIVMQSLSYGRRDAVEVVPSLSLNFDIRSASCSCVTPSLRQSRFHIIVKSPSSPSGSVIVVTSTVSFQCRQFVVVVILLSSIRPRYFFFVIRS